MNYEINENILKLKNGESIKEIVFEYAIRQVVPFDISNYFLVRIEPDIGKILNENIFCFDKNGDFIWQVEPIHYRLPDSPYVGVSISEDGITLYNWDDFDVKVDPKNGKVLGKRFTR